MSSWSAISTGPRGHAVRLFWLSATGIPAAVVIVFRFSPMISLCSPMTRLEISICSLNNRRTTGEVDPAASPGCRIHGGPGWRGGRSHHTCRNEACAEVGLASVPGFSDNGRLYRIGPLIGGAASGRLHADVLTDQRPQVRRFRSSETLPPNSLPRDVMYYARNSGTGVDSLTDG